MLGSPGEGAAAAEPGDSLGARAGSSPHRPPPSQCCGPTFPGLQPWQPGAKLSTSLALWLRSRTSLQFEDEMLRKLDSEVEGGRGDEQYKQLFESM